MKKIKFAFCLLLVLILSMQCLGVSAATPYANYFIVAGEDEMTLPTPAAYEGSQTRGLIRAVADGLHHNSQQRRTH